MVGRKVADNPKPWLKQKQCQNMVQNGIISNLLMKMMSSI
jgi:hypothetical protein